MRIIGTLVNEVILLKWSKIDLIRLPNGVLNFEEEFSFDKSTFEKNSRIRELPNVRVIGTGHYDDTAQRLYIDLDISGEMVVPCDVTFEDVTLPFETTSSEIFSFYKDEDIDVHEAKGDVVELLPVVFQLIYMEIPLKVVKPGKITYPKGDGWEVMKEEDYRKEEKPAMDPRLAKLKEFKPQQD